MTNKINSVKPEYHVIPLIGCRVITIEIIVPINCLSDDEIEQYLDSSFREMGTAEVVKDVLVSETEEEAQTLLNQRAIS